MLLEQYQLMESKYIAKEKTKKKFSVSMQHYTFAVSAFVELVKQFGMDEYEFAVHETKTYDVIDDVKNFRQRDRHSVCERFQPEGAVQAVPGLRPGIPRTGCAAAFMYICGRAIRWPTRS